MYTFQTLAVAAAIGFAGCQQAQSPAHFSDTVKARQQVQTDTITSLDDQQDTMLVFKSPTGKFYNVTYTPEESSAMKAVKFDCTKDDFFGSTRKLAKTSIAPGSASPYTVLTNFLKTLKADSLMEKLVGIKQDSVNKRVAEENKNVKLTRVFIYAIKREDDNDYHMIIGDKKGNFLNVECSGLPGKTAASYTRLSTARKQVKSFFGNVSMWNYRKFEPAIEVEVSGSLFFDKDHDAGAVGPAGLRPNTAWEIHPLTNIVFK